MSESNTRLGWFLAVCIVAAVLRVHGAVTLPMDHDEPVTLKASLAYAQAWEAGGVGELSSVDTNREHPGLLKAIYGYGIGSLGDSASRVEQLAVGRGVSLALGIAGVALVAWVHPLAGALLAVHGLHIKYSAQMYLETGAGLAALVGMLAWFRTRRREDGSTWLVAACFGAAAAAKYVHALPVLVVFGDLCLLAFRRRMRRWEPGVFGLVFLGTFWMLNPQAWIEPVASTWASLAFHPGYAQEMVADGLSAPVWVFWKNLGVPQVGSWHPGLYVAPVEPVLMCGGILALFYGCKRGGAELRLVAAWFSLVAVFLMAWPTRWPQHVMGAIVPLALGLGLELQARTERRYRAL